MRKLNNAFALGKLVLSALVLLLLALHSRAQTDIAIGTGTTGNLSDQFPCPLQDYYEGSRAQYLYLASELTNAGMTAGYISALKYEVTSLNGAGVIESMRITIGGTTVNSLSTNSWDAFSGPTSSTVMMDYQPVMGTNTIVFFTPFYWNGTDNIMVEFCNGDPANVSGPSFWTNNPSIPWTTGLSFNGSHTYRSDNEGNLCGTSFTFNNGNQTTRPNISFTWTANSTCSGTPNAGTANASVTNICPNVDFQISVTGATIAGGITYQWQQSSDNVTWSDIAGATGLGHSLSQTGTSYYRMIAFCGTDSDTSTVVQVVSPTLFAAGTYTINGAMPTGGTNFQTFADAISAMSCGIAGPIVFNVSPGTYNEQVRIPQIAGASSTNTITFNGNGASLVYSPSSFSDRHGIWFDGADHVTIDSLNVDVSAGSYGWGVLFTNKADSNTLTRCTIKTNTNSQWDDYIGIYINGSNTGTWWGGDNGNYNLISGNTVIGGYFGIKLYGDWGLRNLGNVISNNKIQDFHVYGIYTYGNDELLISKNDISRPTRTWVDDWSNYGIYISTGVDVVVEKNRIHNMYDGLASASFADTYGIYISTDGNSPADPNFANNNAIYNITNTNGWVTGISCSGWWFWHFYHNTIVLDDAAATGGETYGLNVAGNLANTVKNNIVYITRGGTGAKYALYYPFLDEPVSDNNVVFVNSAGGSNYIGNFNGTDYATFAGWQAANSGSFDQNSLNVDPLLANPATGNLYPNNTSIAAVGTGVGVTTDIVDSTRSANFPTPGCYEVIPTTGIDVGISGMVAPANKSCYGPNETVTVSIKNYSLSAHDFVANPVTVNVAVTGPNATTFTPVTVNTGTLASNATLDVVVSTAYDMTAAGVYTFTANTTTTGDVNAFNNAMQSAKRTVEALVAGTLSSDPPAYCVTGGIPTLKVANGGGGTIQWQEAADPAGPWTNVGTDTATYVPAAAITDTMYYRVYRTCNGLFDTSAVLTVELNNPQLLTTVPGVRCGPGTVTLSATGSNGVDFNWYTAASGGAPIHTGASYTSPVLNSTTTYYVTASSGGSQVTGGRVAPTTISSTIFDNAGIMFDAAQPFTLVSVDVYNDVNPSTFAVELVNSSGTVLATSPVFNVPAGNGSTPYTLNLNFQVPTGTDHRLIIAATPFPTGGLVREFTPFTPNFPYSLGAAGTLTQGYNFGPIGTYYFFYNWTVSTGCETARQPVVATVNAGPGFDITDNLTICNDAITALQVNSTVSDFNDYQWSPATGLYTDPAATVPYTAGTNASTVYLKLATPGTFTYTATANNTTTTCQGIDSVKVTVLPAAATVMPQPTELCVSGSSVLSISPNPNTFGSASYQWQSSPDNTTYTNIAGATGSSYTTPTITSTTFYKVEIMNSAGTVCLTAYDTVKVNSPSILNTTPDAICGAGSLTLSANASPGATVNWYSAATGGSLVHTGATFNTPTLPSTTTYYVAALEGGAGYIAGITLNQLQFGLCGVPTSSSSSGWALRFTTTKSVLINSVYVIPASAGTVTIALHDYPSTGAITTVTSQSFTTADVGTPQLVPLGMMISTPGNYQLVMQSGGSYRIPTLGCGYPMSTPSGGFTITGSASSATSSPDLTVYNSFFNLSVTEGCESPRVPVVATVSNNTAILSQPISNVATCVGATIKLGVKADGANLTYQWLFNGQPLNDGGSISGATTDTLTISPVSLSDIGSYEVVLNGLCGSNVVSQAVTVNVSAANTWVGAVSTDWNDPANWCGGVPTSTTDVAIFPGTPYSPVINATLADVRTLTINTGASVTVMPNGTLNVYGDFVNNGTFVAPNGFIFFKGTQAQTADAMTVGSVMVNNPAGVTLNGSMSVGQSLVLIDGNLTLGIHDLIVNGSVTGTPASHVVTNNDGSMITRNVTTTPVTVPVGHSADSYNPVIISNGSGRDYSVRVAPGHAPAISNPGLAVNRTWHVTASGATPPANVNITFQYEDGHMNTPGIATNPMEVGVHGGGIWNVVTPMPSGINPSGTPTQRQVAITTSQFGPMVVSNVGGISWATSAPNVDPTVTSIQLLPNVVESSTLLRVMSTRATRLGIQVVDGAGRVVMTLNRQVMVGQNDFPLEFSQLAAGVYYLAGQTDQGKTTVVRFVKM